MTYTSLVSIHYCLKSQTHRNEGFSRGAYTARFLAQMLDYVGLLSPGNEELLRFAWKTFSKWQTGAGDTEEAKKARHQTYVFMQKFRDTFSIPVRRIRFLGLFDTVNSVPRFEAAWMQRSKFPYTAKSSAKVIRHAVSIDERRAKFRQDLISQKRPEPPKKHHKHHLHVPHHHHHDAEKQSAGVAAGGQEAPSGQLAAHSSANNTHDRSDDHLDLPGQHMGTSGAASSTSLRSVNSQTAMKEKVAFAGEDGDVGDQNVEEVWFPGCHADIGGGWPLEKGEEMSISHPPLIWMIREAQKAGLKFDEAALSAAHFAPDTLANESPYHDARESQQPGQSRSHLPILEVEGQAVDGGPPDNKQRAMFASKMHKAAGQGRSHDVLQRNNGAPTGSVISWNIMEYLPFRRMDLRPDGSWAPIRWPLPAGETRDIPPEAWIHNSALKRMEADPKYRPGNLIVGGGGRGMRHAPESVGMGKWRVLRGHGDIIDEIMVRDAEAGNVEALEK